MYDNWTMILATLFVAAPPTIAAVYAAIVSRHNAVQIQEVHLSMNSRFDEWMRLAKLASFAEEIKAAEIKAAEIKAAEIKAAEDVR
jgi:hypothetical protein